MMLVDGHNDGHAAGLDDGHDDFHDDGHDGSHDDGHDGDLVEHWIGKAGRL